MPQYCNYAEIRLCQVESSLKWWLLVGVSIHASYLGQLLFLVWLVLQKNVFRNSYWALAEARLVSNGVTIVKHPQVPKKWRCIIDFCAVTSANQTNALFPQYAGLIQIHNTKIGCDLHGVALVALNAFSEHMLKIIMLMLITATVLCKKILPTSVFMQNLYLLNMTSISGSQRSDLTSAFIKQFTFVSCRFWADSWNMTSLWKQNLISYE